MNLKEIFNKLADKTLDFLPKVFFAALILLVGYFVVLAISKLLKKTLERFSLDPSLISFFNKTAKVVMYVILILSALSAIGVSTTGLVAAFSACAVAISLALKDSLSNIASGIMLLISKPFSTDDFVEIGEDSGTVMKIDLMHTTLKTIDNRHIIIPNGQLATFEVTNYSRETTRMVTLDFSVSYNNDISDVKTAIMNCLYTDERILNEEGKEPFVRIQSYGESAINFSARFWVEAGDYWGVYYELLEKVKLEFDKTGITIPYKQLDVHLIKEDNNKTL